MRYVPRFTKKELEVQKNYVKKPTVKIDGRKFTMEQLEMLMVKVATLKLSPKCWTDSEVAGMLNISSNIVKRFRSNPVYVSIKNSMLDEVRAQWKGEIQAGVIKKAIQGYRWAVDKFYEIENDFVTKVATVSHIEDIPKDPQLLQESINKLILETSDLVMPAPVPETNPVKSKLA